MQPTCVSETVHSFSVKFLLTLTFAQFHSLFLYLLYFALFYGFLLLLIFGSYVLDNKLLIGYD